MRASVSAPARTIPTNAPPTRTVRKKSPARVGARSGAIRRAEGWGQKSDAPYLHNGSRTALFRRGRLFQVFGLRMRPTWGRILRRRSSDRRSHDDEAGLLKMRNKALGLTPRQISTKLLPQIRRQLAHQRHGEEDNCRESAERRHKFEDKRYHHTPSLPLQSEVLAARVAQAVTHMGHDLSGGITLRLSERRTPDTQQTWGGRSCSVP
jgi:hypothetical protein